MSRLLAPARIIMPSRVRLTTQYSASATTMQADRREHAVPGVGHQLAEREAAGEPGRRRHAVHVVADEQAARFLEDEDQRIRHQHLLQVFTLVEVAEEHPFEHEAEQRRQQHAGHAA